MLYTEKTDRELSKELFKNPPAKYRGAPFWAWNTKLTTELLSDQIDVFNKMGFGGFFMHTRVGLEIEYLGDEFMSYIQFCTEYAKEKKLIPWLYDEDRYPSGSAGGFVTRNKKLRARGLILTTEEPEVYDKEFAIERGLEYLVACYDVNFDSDLNLLSYKKIGMEDESKYTKLYAFSKTADETGWFNNQTYADLLSADAVDEFIEVTHKRYKEVVGKDFGKTIYGIFTDEPQLMFNKLPAQKFDGMISIPWSENFEEDFFKATGIDITDILPEIFWDGDNKKYRYIFRRYLSERFADNYSEKIGKWCEDNKIFLTGHMMAEQTMESQTQMIGEAMLHYSGFGICGVDMLLERYEYLTVKQAQSALHQKGDEALLSELYGVTDWDYDFRGYKVQGDWQAALGVTLRVPHLAHLGMKGEAKRDFPASINYQSPWYEEYGVIETHFARLNTALTRGKPVVKVGVIHPIESFWHESVYGRVTKREEMDKQLEELVKWLLFNNIDFDFISEGLSEELGLSAEKDGVRVGKMKYGAILVPNCIELRNTTRAVLDEFEKLGGTLIYTGSVPQYADGEYVKTDKKAIPFEEDEIIKALDGQRNIKIINKNGDSENRMIYNRREEEECEWLFICYGAKADNSKTIRPKPTKEEKVIKIKGEYKVVEYDTLTGDIKDISYCINNGFTYIEKTFYSHDSLLLKLQKAEDKECHTIENKKEKILEYTLKGIFDYDLSEENVLLLDCGKYAVSGEDYSEDEEELLRVDCILKERFNYPKAGMKQAQPWVLGECDRPHNVKIKFSVLCESKTENVSLALEDAEDSKIKLNGKEIQNKPCGYFVDKAIQKVKIGTLEEGENEIEVEIPFGKRSNIEWMYLLGSFGVRLNGTYKVICKRPQKIGFSSVTHQGLPFYTGNISYEADIKTCDGELEITVPKYKGALIRVYLDGRDCGIIAFEPYKLNLGTVKSGEHKLLLKLYGNRFNAFGSLHNTDENNRWAGPERWRTEGSKWGYEYSLRDMGILSGPVIKIYNAGGIENGKDI